MKHIVLFCFVLFCFALKTKSQNLVPNPSFEQYSDCNNPYVTNSVFWCPLMNGGSLPACLTPCQANSYIRAPRQYADACFQSYQSVRTGVVYSSLTIYTQSASQQESGHSQVKLIDTLKAGKIYCVTYYVSLWNNSRYSIDKLGALLTPSSFPCYVPGNPTVAIAGNYTPQVVSTPGVALEDTLGWMEISGSFTAIGNEIYLTLGDFFLHSQHYIKDSYPTNCNGLADYYVDDVSVEEVEIAKAKNDTLIYQGDSTIIGLNNSEAALFSWQPTAGLSCTNCPNPKASPTITTTYTVTKTQCKSVTTDVITITVSPTGVREMSYELGMMSLIPNPTNGLLTITSKYNFEKIELFGVTGQVLLSETVNDKTHQLHLQNLAEGIYFVKIVYANGQSVTKKVVKQ